MKIHSVSIPNEFAKPKINIKSIIRIKPIKEPKKQTQNFFLTYSENLVMLSFSDMKIGLKSINDKLEIIYHKVPTKEQTEAVKITNLMKLLKKSNVSFQDIATRLEPGIYANTLKQFNNIINKPI